jgi:hypothetical protein
MSCELPFLLSLLSLPSFLPSYRNYLHILSSDPIPYRDTISVSELEKSESFYTTAF